MEDAIFRTIGSLGFPAMLCFYLLVKMQKTLDALTEAIKKLNSDVEKREGETQRRIERLEDAVKDMQRG